jgi:hypothetical protein
MSISRKHRCHHLITRTPDAAPPAARGCRIAVFGGDARQRQRWADASGVRFFQSRRGGGNGELRRLVAAVRSRSVALVVVLARWNGHSATRKLRRVCRRYGVAFALEP